MTMEWSRFSIKVGQQHFLGQIKVEGKLLTLVSNTLSSCFATL